MIFEHHQLIDLRVLQSFHKSNADIFEYEEQSTVTVLGIRRRSPQIAVPQIEERGMRYSRDVTEYQFVHFYHYTCTVQYT